ncbi:MAG: xanthine phosphoribosyltransferase [Treponema sp.]|jgi:xanthine phosphoribosyltransferase|nr:xanthine phosphoribosyltransferase [Treponema sp.]
MRLLEERIRQEARVLPGDILNVGSFLNQQVDPLLYDAIGQEFKRRFADTPVTRILTIEASGIGIACITGLYFKVPVVFGRKFRAKNVDSNVWTAEVTSYTHGVDYTVTVPRAFIKESDSILIIDDFLANGCALDGLVEIVSKAGARLAGAGIVIEKGFQNGGRRLREKGIRLESLAVIRSMSPETGISFG